MDLQNAFIGDIVAEDFRTAAIFKRHKIDFCCNGGRTIEAACTAKKIDPAVIYKAIDELPKGNGGDIDFSSWPLDLLADYVERIHHRYVEEKTPIIQAFLDKLCKVHGGRHPELFEIKELFDASAQDLGAHLKKEELILFPFIKNMVKAKQTGEPLKQPQFGSVENPVSMMKHEHNVEGERFRKIAEITDDYTPPADACNTYRVAFAMLQEFEDDLHRHIHIENNILFPKSIELEKEFSVEA
ncbi:iron-sulfur cluster repair di-iron protein [Bergeyella cardium]|uniref:Iron-sulfur cluster repair di-iron protein n=1 Tax=Bergeyella cardium TaxID=1585976 RepID=A0A6P1QV22_9FLAO|nr:iron-sulfur cluster repair di-iron protein [Bergeyella cardium]QHN64514.1 iron-sulfur cluster repair di-iron protein [Bergeyella cardium]WHE33806.1 iron-sulfur cluster repair di-iron protein [Bergeyella cardium]WHF60456.1 iron-sulfur cluster repair di-iron protein [Bergeyella cardium]